MTKPGLLRAWAPMLAAMLLAASLLVVSGALASEASALTPTYEVLKGKKIVLDPGHGGSDSGAVNGTYGLKEKEQNLIVAKDYLAPLLTNSGATVYMTRTEDVYRSNSDRYTYANSTGADVLLSVHMNGSANTGTDYTTVLYGKWYKDRALANAVFEQLSALPAATGSGTIATRAPYQYSSGVLFKSNMPAVMVETIFVTNKDEGRLLSGSTEGPERRKQI